MMESERKSEAPEAGERAVELKIGEGLPAIFVNRFYVTCNPTFTRIVFAERVSTNLDLSRTILILPTADARELGELLGRLISTLTGEHGPAETTDDQRNV
jgi:hypothetical protein